jgi:hypothetical protein
MRIATRLFPLVLLFTSACGDVEGDDHDHDHDHENEVITTVELTFTPQSGGSATVFSWADLENDGSPVIDDIALTDGEAYDVTVSFLNELEDPVEDMTTEIGDEAEEHQLFFTGTGVQGPANPTNANAVVEHTYADTDSGGLPIGLDNTFTTLGTGSGELIVTLRHLPEENGSAVKVDGLAEDVDTSGFASIGGDNDVQVTFNIDVQ